MKVGNAVCIQRNQHEVDMSNHLNFFDSGLSMVYMGVDPGMSGAVALVSRHAVKAFPFKKLTERDIWETFHGAGADFALLEQVHSMPKQGVASSFKFGRSYGFLRCCLVASGVPFEEITPVKWQTLMRCRTRGDKNITKARAQQLFPAIKVTHAIADALLLAELCKRIKTGEV